MEATKEASKDKVMVNEILAKINDENIREVVEKSRKVEETRLLIKQYQKKREEQQKDLTNQEEEHDEKIAAYNDMMQQRRELERQQKRLAEVEKKKMWTRVAKETQNFNQSKEEYNLLRDMLWEQELEEKQKKEEEEAILRNMNLKENTLRQNLEQIEAKKERTHKMEEEEHRLVRQMLDKFERDEEDEKARQTTIFNAKRRFMTEAQNQRFERKHMFMQEKQNEYQERHAGVEQKEYRQRVIAEARKRLLATHAAQVQGFLPKVSFLSTLFPRTSHFIPSYLSKYLTKCHVFYNQGAIINQDEAKLFQQARQVKTNPKY